MKLANRVLALVLSILMLLSAMPVFADAAAIASFSDFPRGTWSEEAMTAAVNNSLLKGKGNGTIAPRDYLTRAEAAAVINRAFGATVKADISAFTDVQPGTWYYDEIAKAVNMQTIVGVSATKANPTGNITRESMLAVLARALVLDEADASELSKFTDGSSVSPWAKGQVAAMAKRGYVNGNENKELNPQSYITREEFAQVMHNIFKVYIPETVTIDNGIYGTTVIRAKDVTLNNVTINGDLIAGDGVGDGNLNLTNVTVTGRILFRGGEGKVKLTNTTVGEKVVINDVNGVVNFLNYRAEEPFKNIQENTKATFLNMKVNTGGGGSSTPSRAEYKIREYVQNIDGSYPSSAKYTDEKMADYGETITYNPRNIEGFTFDATHPDSVLSGTNKGNLTLKAYYTRNKYTVSFDGYEVELPYGENISKDNPLKDKMQATIDENKEAGYNTEFKDGTGKEVKIDDTTVGAEDLPIYAIKTPIEYNIIYNLNGGKIEGEYDKTFNVEKEIILPVNVVKKGYTFGGWTDENGAPVTKIDVGNKGNKTFNANWNIVTYKITYEVGPYGALDGTQKIEYTVEDADFTLPTPVVTKQDYIFKGWYTNANFTGRPITVLNPQDAEDKTYYARIEERTYEQYTIKFDGKTYTVTEGEKIGDAVDGQGNKLSDAMDNVTYPKGYEADNFRIKGDDTTVITKDTIATEDMEIVAAKKPIKYTIDFVLNGGKFEGVIPKTEYTVEDADYTLPVPEKTDYVFLGWFEKADFSDTEVKILDTADAENKTYYANWKKVTYTITFNGTQYTVEKDAKISEATDANGNKLGTAMDNVTYPKGYEADGFYIKGDTSAAVTKDTPATGNMEIVAAKKATVYTITYELDGGSLDGTQKNEYTVEDADYTLPTPAKAGYTFLGWYEKGVKVEILDTADAENKTYVASWRAPAATVYKVTFKGTDYDVTQNNALYTNEDLKDAMDEASVKQGYNVTFNTKDDGTGAIVDTSYVPTGDVTIYAIEKAIVYTITYEENGGDDIADDTYTIEDADITLPVPTRDGYVFRGWYEEAGFSGDVVTVLDTADLENKTYYAKWVLDNAVLSFDHEISSDIVTLKVMLNAIPADIDDIAAMSIRYDFDNKKLEYVSTTSNVGEVTAASAGYISWYTTSNYITADTLTAKDNVLFTITFNVKDGQYGTTKVSYTSAEITASEPVGNPAVAEKYTKKYETIDLGTQVQTYTITYVENGGDDIPDGSYTAGDADITLPTPTRAYYAFKGWYEESDFSGDAVVELDTADAEDKTYYAKWVIETATLGFSSEIIGNTVKIYVTLDEIPSDIDEISAFTLKYKHPDNKLTYVSGATAFGGQFSSQDGYISWYNENNAITSEALKANNIVATLEFSKTDSASGIETFEYTAVEIVASKPVGNPAIATKYITKKEEVQLDAATYVVTFKEQTYNITPGNALSSNALLVAAMNEAANKSGYTVTFKADGTGENVTTAYVPTGSMTVYVVENAIEYSITYELDGGALDGTQKTSYTVEDADYTLPTPAKDNYDFLGWYENGVKVDVLDTADAENKTYYASWKYNIPALDVYKITFNGNVYDVTENNALLTNANLKNAMEVVADKTGYIVAFNTKADGTGENVTTAYVPTGDMEIFVIETLKVYNITYVLDGGALDGTEKTSYTVEDEDYTLPTPTKDGFTFLGWYEDGTEVTVLDTADAEDKTYTAKWEESLETIYTITYELGGIGEMPAEAWNEYKTSQLVYTLLSPVDNTETHVFVAWYDNAEFTGSPVTVIAEGTTGDLKFYAKWEEISEDEYTITYVTNGGTLDGTQKITYKSSDSSYTLPIPEKGEVPFLGWYENEECAGDPVTELVAGSTGNKTYYAKWQEYTLQFYLGTKISRNKPVSDDGDRGQMIVEHGAALTQADVDRELGMLPSEYKVQEGYVDSDGVVHEIVPELWYQKNGEWTKFIPEEIQVVSDMNIHLFIRFLAFEYNTDLEIKGIDMSKLDFSITVPYDSYTDIGKTYLDFITNTGETLNRVLNGIEDQGYDLYQMAIDKAASKGLVDTDGNIMNPNVPLPIHRFITEEMIMEEIDRYIDANINNEDFIADLLRNDAVVDMILNDEELKHTAMGDPSIREIFLTDDFIKEIIRLHPEFVDIMIEHDEFIDLIIDNDATFDYVLNDDTMVAKILANDAFKGKVIEEGTVYIVDVYFGDGGDQDIKDYITKQLKSEEVKTKLKEIIRDDANVKASLKETLKVDADAKAIIKTEIKKMLDDDTKKDEIKQKIKDFLMANSNLVKEDVKDYIKSKKGEADFKAKVKDYIEDKKDTADFKAKVKTYIIGLKDTAEFQAKVKTYIEGKKGEADFKDKVESYIEGKKNETDFKADVKDYIEGKKNESDFKGKVETYIEGKKDDTSFKGNIKTYAKDRAKTDKSTVLNNATVKSAFLTEVNDVLVAEDLTGTVTAEEILEKYLNGTLETEYPEIAAEIDDAYSLAFEDNYESYFEENYDSLFNTYFGDYFSDNYDTLFADYFEDYFTDNYDTLFTEYFGEYFTNSYDSLFSEYFDEYFTNSYDNLFTDYFEEYFDGSYDSLFTDYFEDYFEDNYDDIFADYFEEYFENNYDTLFTDNFSEYYDNLDDADFDELVDEHFDTFFNNQFDTLFEEYFDDYFETVFDSLYESNVEKWAKLAYDEPSTKTTVEDTIADVISDLVESYIAGNADDELKKFINKIVEEFGVKEYVRDNYDTDSNLKATIDQLVKDNARIIIDDYANNRASEDIVKLIDDNMHKYIEEIVDDYVNYDLDEELMAFIDEEIDIYMLDYINKYIDGTDRTLLSKLVPTYAHDAVEAIKKTDAFKNTITDFASGNGVRVNKDNLMFVEVLDELMHTYNYDKLASDFLPEKIQKVVDLIGHDTVAHIVDDYFAAFCLEMDTAIANLKADQEAGIEDTEYKFSTTPAVRINYMEIIDNYYTALTGKLRNKINSQSKIPVSSNPYAQRIVDMDYFALIFDRTGEETEYKSGYKLKDDVMEYYDNMVMLQVLVHDAVTFYGRVDTYTWEEKLDSASLLVGTYANKLNDVIMNFIENGELPKGYTLEDILDINGKIESLYNKFKDKIEKGEDLYAEYLDKDYTDIIDFANMSIYSDGDAYKIYQIIFENGEDAFDLDDAITAIFDSPNYRGISKIEDAMAKVESKIKDYAYDPSAEASTNEKNMTAFVDGYKGTFESKEIKGYETGTHTLALQRYLRYYK